MARNMQYYYRTQTTKDLRVARSKKLGQLQRLVGQNSYFAKQDRNRLTRQIEWIEIELESRDLQQALF